MLALLIVAIVVCVAFFAWALCKAASGSMPGIDDVNEEVEK